MVVSKTLLTSKKSLLSHCCKRTSGSKLQRIFWLVMNGPLRKVSTQTTVISCLSHSVSRTCIFITQENCLMSADIFRASTWWLECVAQRGFLLQTRHCLTQCHFISLKTITRCIITTLSQHNRHCVNNSSAPFPPVLSPCCSDVSH